jgi:DNA-binding phage protein
MDDRKAVLASILMRDRDTTIAEVCEAVGVSRATLYRYLKPAGTPRDHAGRPRGPGQARGGTSSEG